MPDLRTHNIQFGIYRVGCKPFYKPAKSGRRQAYIDITWGKNIPDQGKIAGWRHVIALDEFAEQLMQLSPGDYVKLRGYTKINPQVNRNTGEYIYDADGRLVSKEYIIIEAGDEDTGGLLKLLHESNGKQLSLVGGEGKPGATSQLMPTPA